MVYPNPQPGPGWDVFSFARWVHSMSRCQLGMISEPQFRSGNFLATRFHRDVSKHTVDGGHAKSPVDGEHPMFFFMISAKGLQDFGHFTTEKNTMAMSLLSSGILGCLGRDAHSLCHGCLVSQGDDQLSLEGEVREVRGLGVFNTHKLVM